MSKKNTSTNKKGGKKKHMTNVEKAKCLAWVQERVMQEEIARRLHISKSSVKRLVAKSIQGVG